MSLAVSCLSLLAASKTILLAFLSVFVQTLPTADPLHLDLLAVGASVSEAKLQQENTDHSAAGSHHWRFTHLFTLFCRLFRDSAVSVGVSVWVSPNCDRSPPSSTLPVRPHQRRPLVMSQCWRFWEAWWWAAMPSTGSTCVEGCSSWSPLLGNLLDTRLCTCCSCWCACVSTRWVHSSHLHWLKHILNCSHLLSKTLDLGFEYNCKWKKFSHSILKYKYKYLG